MDIVDALLRYRSSGLSEYELERLEQVAANQGELRRLGLIDDVESKKAIKKRKAVGAPTAGPVRASERPRAPPTFYGYQTAEPEASDDDGRGRRTRALHDYSRLRTPRGMSDDDIASIEDMNDEDAIGVLTSKRNKGPMLRHDIAAVPDDQVEWFPGCGEKARKNHYNTSMLKTAAQLPEHARLQVFDALSPEEQEKFERTQKLPYDANYNNDTGEYDSYKYVYYFVSKSGKHHFRATRHGTKDTIGSFCNAEIAAYVTKYSQLYPNKPTGELLDELGLSLWKNREDASSDAGGAGEFQQSSSTQGTQPTLPLPEGMQAPLAQDMLKPALPLPEGMLVFSQSQPAPLPQSLLLGADENDDETPLDLWQQVALNAGNSPSWRDDVDEVDELGELLPGVEEFSELTGASVIGTKVAGKSTLPSATVVVPPLSSDVKLAVDAAQLAATQAVAAALLSTAQDARAVSAPLPTLPPIPIPLPLSSAALADNPSPFQLDAASMVKDDSSRLAGDDVRPLGALDDDSSGTGLYSCAECHDPLEVGKKVVKGAIRCEVCGVWWCWACAKFPTEFKMAWYGRTATWCCGEHCIDENMLRCRS